MNVNAAFQWKCQPEAEQLILNALEKSIQSNSDILQLSDELFSQTSTRLFDWLDHVVLEDSPELRNACEALGFVQDTKQAALWYHPGAQLPKIVLTNRSSALGIAVSVDYIADFLMSRGANRPIEGALFGNFRQCLYSTQNNHALWIVERRGSPTIIPTEESPEKIQLYHWAIEAWQIRPRSLSNEEEDLEKALQLAAELIKQVGQTRAAWTVLEVERRYWQTRNTAAQVQKNRQDRLGMGWANHDHHTFRSSRSHFNRLVQLFELLGFRCRERFYAGEEAGWGAQVMEHPDCRLILFLDVDLAPHEIVKDFAYQKLLPLDRLGTVGLWCALHGDSIQHSGMHHLEAQFMFDNLTEDLAERGVKMMNAFSTFPYLRQAFTQAEMWKVNPERIQELLQSNLITPEQAEKFFAHGAVGSHLENLQRREGYKGFNQKNVSIIIQETDPRQAD